MYASNDILFPRKAIPAIRKMRGPQWQALVEHVLSLPESHEESLAFMLMMIRLNGCLECETDSYRAMRGCDLCAIQTIRRYKGSDGDLIAKYNDALVAARNYLTERVPIFEFA